MVLLAFSMLLFVTGQFVMPSAVSPKTWLFLVLSGLATGASWLCHFRALKLGPVRAGITMIGAGAVLLAVKF